MATSVLREKDLKEILVLLGEAGGRIQKLELFIDNKLAEIELYRERVGAMAQDEIAARVKAQVDEYA